MLKRNNPRGIVAASAATRWGIFHVGLASVGDPKYTARPSGSG